MKERPLDSTQKKVDKFIQQLETFDRSKRSSKSLESATNWMLAICAGTLLWFLGSFDKFIVSGVLFNKILFLFAVLFLSISVIFFIFSRAILFLRQIGIDIAFDDIQGLPYLIDLNRRSRANKELNNKVNRILYRSMHLFRVSHNIMSSIPPLIKWGLIFYTFGFINLSLYVIIFIIEYT